MSSCPKHLRPCREKVFGPGPRRPLDREAKLRIKTCARAKLERTQAGKAYGVITAKALAVLDALLWGFHNSKSGQCNPSYETIAKKAGCARSTVAMAIKALEAAGVLTWVNRITRARSHARDLFGHWVTRWRVIRTSNAYLFHDPKMTGSRGVSSKSENRTGTTIPESLHSDPPRPFASLNTNSPLDRALIALGKTLGAVPKPATG